MRSSSQRGLRWLALAGGLAAGGIALAAAAGSPALASVGGSAQAQAANVSLGDITLAASTTGPLFDDLAAQLDGEALAVGESVVTDAVSTPEAPFGVVSDQLDGLELPVASPVVSLGTVVVQTARTSDAAYSEYWQSYQDGLEALSTIAVVSVQLGTIPILSAEEITSRADARVNDLAPGVVDPPTAKADVAALSIGGTSFELVPNVPVSTEIILNDAQLEALVRGIAGLPFDDLSVLSWFGSITVTAQSSTAVGADTASAVGLQAVATLDLHVSLGSGPNAMRGLRAAAQPAPVLELNATGTLLDMVLAATEVSRPQADPAPTTTAPVASTTTLVASTTTVPLPPTGSASTPSVMVWALIVTGSGAAISLLVRPSLRRTRRR